MSSEAELSELSRDQLVERIERLEEQIAEIKASKADSNKTITRDQFNQFIARLTSCDIEDFTADPFQYLGAVDDFGDRVQNVLTTVQRHESIIDERHTPQGAGPEEHWWNVVQYAYNVQDQPTNKLPGSWVALYKDDVAAATGVGERRAGQLIDEWGGASEGRDGKQGTRHQPYQRANAGNKHNPTRKAIKINLDVWEEPQ